jgi:hypothetical protein
MSDPQPMMNAPESRTPTGEILDQATPPTETPTTTPTETPTPTPPPKPAETPSVPDQYEFTLPEGVKLEGETLTKATDLFKKAGLSQEIAQSFVDFHVAQLQAAGKAPIEAYESLRNEWKSAQTADPEIGPKSAQIRENIGKALDSIGDAKLTADFKFAMDLTGLGDNPAVIKVMNAWAKQVIEGRPVIAGGPAPVKSPDAKPVSVASAMYPNLP